MSKSKKSILTALVAFIMLLALSVSAALTGLSSAQAAEIPVAGSFTGGAAYTKDTTEKGSIAYTDSLAISGGGGTTASGALLTAKQTGTVTFDLGNYDLTGKTAEKPLITVMPFTGNVNYSGFEAIFTSGTKSFAIKSFKNAASAGWYTSGVRGDNQKYYRAAQFYQHYQLSYGAAEGTKTIGTFPHNPYNGSSNNNYSVWHEGTVKTLSTYNIAAQANMSYYLDTTTSGVMAGANNTNNTASKPFSIYTDVMCATSAAGGTPAYTSYTAFQTKFVYNTADTYRYLFRPLTEAVSSEAAWVPFTADEMANVNVKVSMYEVTAESTLLITNLNGNAVTATTGMKVVEGIKLSTSDGIAKTLTANDNKLTINKSLMLADNDLNTPLAQIALFPKTYGSQAMGTFTLDSFKTGEYTSNPQGHPDFNASYAPQKAKMENDVESITMTLADKNDPTKNVQVYIGYRQPYDAGGTTYYLAKASTQVGENATKFWSYNFNNANQGLNSFTSIPNGMNGVRFDGFIAGGELDSHGLAPGNYDKILDPIYSIYYDSATNSLYTDCGRSNGHGITTAPNGGFRTKILDLGQVNVMFPGFALDEVIFSVEVELRDHENDNYNVDGERDLSNDSATVMVTVLDGQSLANDGTNFTAPVVKSAVYAESALTDERTTIGEPYTVKSAALKQHSLFGGVVAFDALEVKIFDSYDAPVEHVDGTFTPVKSTPYTVKYVKTDGSNEVVASYTVTAGAAYRADNITELFTQLNAGKASDTLPLVYGDLPDWMSFDGKGVMVETVNAVTTGSHYYTWGGRGNDGLGVQFTKNVYVGSNTVTSDSYDSLIKVSFPNTAATYKGEPSSAISYVMNMYDSANKDKYISLFFVPDNGRTRVKAAGSWEMPKATNPIRESLWHVGGEGSDLVVLENETGQNTPAWETGIIINGLTMSQADVGAVEVAFDYATGKLYVIYNGIKTFVRDFRNYAPAGCSTFDGFTDGEVQLTFGVDMPNHRHHDASDASAATGKFCVMGIAGVDLAADADGNIEDKAVYAFRPTSLAGDDLVFSEILNGTVLGGMTPITSGYITVTGQASLAKSAYSPTLKIDGANVKAGAYNILYHDAETPEASVSVVNIPFAINPAIVPTQTLTNVAVTWDGVSATELPAKSNASGTHIITVDPIDGFYLTSLVIGGIDVTSSFTQADGNATSGTFTYVNGSDADDVIEIVATVAPIEYNILYKIDVNGVTVAGTADTDYTATYNVTDTTITVPAVSGLDAAYELLGWYWEGAKVESGDYVYSAMPTKATNLVLVARFKPVDQTATLYYGAQFGGNVEKDFIYTVVNKADIKAQIDALMADKTPSNLTEGTYIEGWYTDNNAWQNQVTSWDGEAELYAKIGSGYKLTFDDGVSATTTTVTVVPNAVYTPATPEKAGHTFLHWAIDGQEFDFSAAITAAQDNKTVTAVWQINTFTVKYIVDGQETTIATPVPYGTKVSELDLPTLAQVANKVAGWSMANDAIITEDVTLVAVYKPMFITVTFDTDGGSEIAAKQVAIGDMVLAPAHPTKAGYVFDGWYVGDTKYEFGKTANADVTLKAKWTAVETSGGTATDEVQGTVVPVEVKGCAKEAASMLAVVLTALAAALVIKKRG